MRNAGTIDRLVRAVVGLGVISLVFVGPQTPWGWIGAIPLATALMSWCPLYGLLGHQDTRPHAPAVRHQHRVSHDRLSPTLPVVDRDLMQAQRLPLSLGCARARGLGRPDENTSNSTEQTIDFMASPLCDRSWDLAEP